MTTKSGLYLHVPFCSNKCGYCDFNSWEETRRGPQEQWLATLSQQADTWKQIAAQNGTSLEFDTVFFGGGTPSLLDTKSLLAVGDLVRSFCIEKGAEFTVECNPESLTVEKLEALSAMGVNRISVGIQSFDDVYLERLERKARKVENLRALQLLRDFWKGSWSLDLMFALPGQSADHWRQTLATALEYEPSHLSAYQLTLTTARAKNWDQAGEEGLLEFFDLTEEILEGLGLKRYEVSNFAKPGFESRHNLKYWRLEPFLGLGPGASGLIPASWVGQSGYGFHQKNPNSLEAWNSSSLTPADEIKKLHLRSGLDHVFELLMMGLRLEEGLKKDRFGLLQPTLSESLKEFIRLNYFNDLGHSWAPTGKGLRLLDTLLPSVYQQFEKNLSKDAAQNLDLSIFDPRF